MIRNYHNHKLQTNPWYREEEPHNNHETPGRQSKATIEMIANLEWTQSNAQQKSLIITNELTTTEPPP